MIFIVFIANTQWVFCLFMTHRISPWWLIKTVCVSVGGRGLFLGPHPLFSRWTVSARNSRTGRRDGGRSRDMHQGSVPLQAAQQRRAGPRRQVHPQVPGRRLRSACGELASLWRSNWARMDFSGPSSPGVTLLKKLRKQSFGNQIDFFLLFSCLFSLSLFFFNAPSSNGLILTGCVSGPGL